MLEDLFRPRSLVEIAILAVLYFLVLRAIRGTRGAGVLKGLILFAVFAFVGAVRVADWLGLEHLKAMLTWLLSGSYIAAVVIFAPELRRALARLARTRFLLPLVGGGTSPGVVDEIVAAVGRLSQRKHGALIVLEREVGLGEFAEEGSKLDAVLTAELLETIFFPDNPLHDGAVLVRHDRIAAAAVFLPLTEDQGLSKSMGTRHRAALGVTDDSDAAVVVVSEETGRVSLVVGAKIAGDLTPDALGQALRELLSGRDKPSVSLAPPPLETRSVEVRK